jgi:hypothetical protein
MTLIRILCVGIPVGLEVARMRLCPDDQCQKMTVQLLVHVLDYVERADAAEYSAIV